MHTAPTSEENSSIGRTLISEGQYAYLLALCQFLLERAGYVVQHARDGMEAQGLVDMHDHLDLILLDINLPFINGLDVLNHIRKNPR